MTTMREEFTLLRQQLANSAPGEESKFPVDLPVRSPEEARQLFEVIKVEGARQKLVKYYNIFLNIFS
jgi:hypothetical protein